MARRFLGIESGPYLAIDAPSAMPPKSAPAAASEQTFEAALERLEEIVESMEGDNLPLEKLLAQYEEGAKLLKVCQEKLESAERKVELITKGASGKPQAAPFEPAAIAASAPASSEPAEAAPAPVRKGGDQVSLF